MGIVIFLNVDVDTAAFLHACKEIPAGTEYVEHRDFDALTTVLVEHGQSIDAIVVGADVDQPIRVAQRIYTRNKDIGVLLLAAPDRVAQMNRALLISPFIAAGTTTVPIDSRELLQHALRRLVLTTRQRRNNRATVAAAEHQLAVNVTPTLPDTYVEHLLHHAPIGVVATDTRGTVLTWNSFATQLMGVSERQAAGEHFANFFPVDKRAEIDALITKSLLGNGGKASTRLVVELENLALEIAASMLEGTQADPRAVLLLRDVTAELIARREAANARDQALQASRAKSTFLANMSHELRTPLNAIIGYSEMLEEQAQDAELDEMALDLKRIHTAGRHLLSLINDILDLSKIEAGRMETYVSRVEVRGLVDEIAGTVKPLVEKNDNSFEVVYAADPGEMQTDETKLRQILLNLLGNAAKFTENGKVKLLIERVTQAHGDTMLFRISDTGIGMNEDQIAQLFQEFTQVDPSTTRRHGGTGLGLAISRRFSRMLQGEISVRSKPGEGSMFTLELPAVLLGRTSSSGENLVGSGPPTLAPIFHPNTVLVIDDDPSVQNLMKRVLEKEDYRVVIAEHGRRGVELAREVKPRAITLDVLMPEMDGWSVLGELRSDSRLAEIPVVVISIIDDKNLGFALGATDYLTKPVERERLLAVLRKYRCDLKGCKVLLVEDDHDTRDMVKRLLDGSGSVVSVASNGREGLAQMKSDTPDLILLDLMMPVMDGFEFLQTIRKVGAWRTIPVVVVTAKDLDEEERHFLNGRVAHVLQKGQFTRDQLMQELCAVIEHVAGRQ